MVYQRLRKRTAYRKYQKLRIRYNLLLYLPDMGMCRYHQYRQAETQVTNGYKISYNNHYLGVSGTTISDHDDAWEFSNNLLSIYINNVQYYLTHNLTLSTTTQETWTRNGNRLYYITGGIFGIGGTSHYLIYKKEEN